jgi:hypothetical protein
MAMASLQGAPTDSMHSKAVDANLPRPPALAPATVWERLLIAGRAPDRYNSPTLADDTAAHICAWLEFEPSISSNRPHSEQRKRRRTTYVELPFTPCGTDDPILKRFEYRASQGTQGWEILRLLEVISRLRRTSRLLLLRRVALFAPRNTAQRATCRKVHELTAEQIRVIMHSMVYMVEL